MIQPYSKCSILDDKWLNRRIEGHQRHDSSPSGTHALIHGHEMHLHQMLLSNAIDEQTLLEQTGYQAI